MKKIILLILTTFIGLLVFSGNVKALNSDATATCVYTIPDNSIFKSATFVYKNNDIQKTCLHNSLRNDTFFTCNIANDLTAAYFVDKKTDKLYCPTLYYYYKMSSPDTALIYTFEISYSEFKLGFVEKIRGLASAGKMTLSSSNLNQGSIPITEEDKTENLQCICGDVLIKHGSITFGGYLGSYIINKPKWVNFNLDNFKECPSALYYIDKVPIIGSANITVSDQYFEKSQEVACATTEAAAGWQGSSGNDTDYKPQEDKIGSFCSETAGVWKVFGYLVMALKILVPVIIIVMGSLDLGKAVVANSEDEMKKATQVLVKRIIAGIVIFFIPTIVNLVLKLASNYVSVVDSGSSCIECVSTPGSC